MIHSTLRVEVKTSRYRLYNGRRKGYQFCFERENHATLTADYVMLVCWDDRRPDLDVFILPASEINGNKKISIPSQPADYKGKYARWLNAWDLVTY